VKKSGKVFTGHCKLNLREMKKIWAKKQRWDRQNNFCTFEVLEVKCNHWMLRKHIFNCQKTRRQGSRCSWVQWRESKILLPDRKHHHSSHETRRNQPKCASRSPRSCARYTAAECQNVVESSNNEQRAWQPSALPKYHIPCTSWCSTRYLDRVIPKKW
jgi:hypothetical protein